MKVVILQPCYIPWRGYFHQIQKADLFIFYDCVQYDDRGWRNRNIVKTNKGPLWLSIPTRSKGVQAQQTPIADVEIVWEKDWRKKHLGSIQMNYSKAPYYSLYKNFLNDIYTQKHHKLADFTCYSTERLALELGITNTEFLRSSSMKISGTKTDRLLNILKKVNAKTYISGPSAKAYMEEEKFFDTGISIEYMQYDYPQ